MVLELTTTTSVIMLAVVAAAVGFVIGWLLRPWLVADRLREDYEAQLVAQSEELAAVRRDLSTVASDLSAATADLEIAEANAVRLEANLGSASARSSELEASLEREGMEKDAEIERLGAEAAKVGGLESRLAELEASASAETADTGTLQAELDACRKAVAERDATIAELRATVAAPPAAPDKETATRRVAEIARRTRGDSALVDDDLERIHGIGPHIAGLLKGMDITSFRQVARFEASDIAYVAAALEAFPDRIERDDWKSSAAELHQETYGEPA